MLLHDSRVDSINSRSVSARISVEDIVADAQIGSPLYAVEVHLRKQSEERTAS